SDIRLLNFTLATGANSHDASRVIRVELSGSFRVPFFSHGLQYNVRRGQKQQTVANDWRTLSARRQSSDPPSFRSLCKGVCHQALVRLKVASQHNNLVGLAVTPVHRSRPSILKHRTVCLPDSPAVAPIEAEQVRVLSLMVEHQQFTSQNR